MFGAKEIDEDQRQNIAAFGSSYIDQRWSFFQDNIKAYSVLS
jgi:hypothetical protein